MYTSPGTAAIDLRRKNAPQDDKSKLSIFSAAAELTTHLPARTQTSAHLRPERSTPSSFSSNSCHRGQGNPACSAPLATHLASEPPEQLRAPVATCCRAGVRRPQSCSPTGCDHSG